MHRCGAILLKHVLVHEEGASLGRSCPCGGTFLDKRCQPKSILTVLGPVRLVRMRQRYNRCKAWRVPGDMVLDVVKTGFSPGLRRMMAKTGATVCFDKARDFIGELAAIRVTDKDAERIAEAIGADIARRDEQEVEAVLAGHEPELSVSPSTLYIASDGTGVPVLKSESAGRRGKAADGTARTREVKLGALFTQSTRDKKGNPLRERFSTQYVGKIESVESFGPRLYTTALHKGLAQAGRVVVIGDGAPWIWNLAAEHFPEAGQIVDFYHAKEHLGSLAKILFPDDEDSRKTWLNPLCDQLWQGKIEALLSELRLWRTRGKKKIELDKTIGYFEKNQSRMCYAEFRQQGLFIGSGVVEAGCKSLIGLKLKQSGMHWTVRGANSIIALRCCIESGKFEDYWESRRAA